jgi:predicted O-methyltransferase YrrM
MHKVIERIRQSGTVTGRSGKTHKLHSSKKQLEGTFVYNLIKADTAVRKTLEIGCGQGLLSLHICAATEGREDAWHTIIDPLQTTQWDGIGIKNLDSAAFESFTLVEKKSEFAMPALAQKNEGQFDLVFINGWHTFDHALVDCFYATRLLRHGGYLVLDSVAFPSIGRVVSLINKWPCYEEFASASEPRSASSSIKLIRFLMTPVQKEIWGRLLSPVLIQKLLNKHSTRVVAFKKADTDNRPTHWHDDCF